MPELPEVEVTRRSFADRIRGARILRAVEGKPLRWPLGVLPESLIDREVIEVGRRGKYLLLRLDEGVLLMHLGMSGSLVFSNALAERGPHDHFDLVTTAGTLRLHDPRRFGAVVWSESEAHEPARKLLSRLGAEPLEDEFDAQRFHEGLKVRRAPIKQVLLSGDIVVGVGNIYASEALFLAGIRPTVKASALSRARATRLHAAIRQVLSRAVERGGTTLRDFSNALGETGHFQLEAAVYGMQSQPCTRCGTPIKKIVQGQRSTFFCPVCQR